MCTLNFQGFHFTYFTANIFLCTIFDNEKICLAPSMCTIRF
ncbi:unnamed protein product [Spirodela intermedia]|uniref:Uncharacterized protein n=1 Tax=Spirodela intermedia TaxID=51605 RepID=A0ABN7EBX9_SPIIN|nr:unnamed protein product [Spirodela intermedia]